MKTAVYPGSFDPITNGHLDIVGRAHKFFDKLYVLVARSYDKTGLFTVEERLELIKESVASFSGKIEIVEWSGLTTDFVKQNDVSCIIRGVRSSVDFRTEQTLANINHELYESCETLLLCCRPEYRDVSSRLVKEIAMHNGKLNKFVPNHVAEALIKKCRGV
jgi:pantetheine-phosphate adenylyltransferase